MSATLSNLPKWLLAFVVAGILIGYHQQVECKLTGCKSTVAAQASEADPCGDSESPSEDQDCQCQCHFVTLSFCESPTVYVGFAWVSSTVPPGGVPSVPEAPCLDIEHPPQLS